MKKLSKQKNRIPYTAPLKSRASIVSYLTSEQGCREPHDSYYFCFNVKLYKLNLSFDSLLKRWQEVEGSEPIWHNPEYVSALRAKYDSLDETDVSLLFDRATEDAYNTVVEWNKDQNTLLASDSYSYVWGVGTKQHVELSFIGRSNGWLALTNWNGLDFESISIDDLLEWLGELSYSALRTFYKWVRMMEYEFDGENPEREVTYHAAWLFFTQACEEIEKPGVFVGSGI